MTPDNSHETAAVRGLLLSSVLCAVGSMIASFYHHRQHVNPKALTMRTAVRYLFYIPGDTISPDLILWM